MTAFAPIRADEVLLQRRGDAELTSELLGQGIDADGAELDQVRAQATAELPPHRQSGVELLSVDVTAGEEQGPDGLSRDHGNSRSG